VTRYGRYVVYITNFDHVVKSDVKEGCSLFNKYRRVSSGQWQMIFLILAKLICVARKVCTGMGGYDLFLL